MKLFERKTHKFMNAIKTDMRAVTERSIEIEWVGIEGGFYAGESHCFSVFENIDRDGTIGKQWIQNWQGDDITDCFNSREKAAIFEAVHNYWTNK